MPKKGLKNENPKRHVPCLSAQPEQEQKMALPFKKTAVSFQNISYCVDMPPEHEKCVLSSVCARSCPRLPALPACLLHWQV